MKMTRSDLIAASKPKPEGGSGIAQQFWDWCEQQARPHT